MSANGVFYYFCESCGADTATYGRSNVCIYCHSHGQLVLVTDPAADNQTSEIAAKLEAMREKWAATHGGLAGESKRKSKWFGGRHP